MGDERRQVWQVVGGGEKGGIIVRAGKDTQSEALDRISTGAFVLQLALEDERLHYERLSGTGPQQGWVGIKLKGKDLCVPSDKQVITLQLMHPASREPVHVCDFYALEESTVASVKTSCCKKFPGLKPASMIPIKVKKGEREEGGGGGAESPRLDETQTLKDARVEDGDEFAFIYMGDINADFPPLEQQEED
eukprot:CAMPEP_0197924644 /NCGR_PEP_ID=MMETSP1439-20131203/96054_1 /TAXON_ID=66791 /ORGANISM="Gonyaulax spinifera, Strain CCMP409" /LENGTH=191 /DNA_ID=CAMNT_0043547081 /DNA_START=67 /DNA_END=642 /DNA_ORIENTATION=+